MKKIKKAIFPVGGFGTRFLPATKSMPKEMLPVVNKPIIQYAFEEAKNAGIEQFIFITGRNKNAINNHFDHAYELELNLDLKQKSNELEKIMSWLPSAGQIAFVRQQKPLGLGHAVWCARNFIGDDEPFLVILADELILDGSDFLKSMIDDYYHKDPESSILGVIEVEKKDTNKYGIIKIDQKSGKIINMVEKPDPGSAPSNLAINGRYILQPEIFKYLENAKLGKGGEIQLTDAMNSMLDKHPYYHQLYQGMRFDCGNILGFLEANIVYGLRNEEIKSDFAKMLKKYKS